MNLHMRYHVWSHIATLLSIATLAVATEEPLPLLLAIPVLLWSAIRFRNRLDAALPQIVVNGLLIAALTLFVADVTSQGIDQVISAVGRFVVALTLIKLIEKRSVRDQGQLLTLGLMMAIGAALTSVTFETGMMFLLYAPTIVWTLVLFQLWAGAVAQHAERDRARRPQAMRAIVPRVVVVPRALARGARRLTAVALIGILAVTVGVFVAVPRSVGQGILGSWDEPARFESGFKDHVQLGAEGSITESSNVVLEAEVIVNTTTQLRTSGELRYLLRGAVLDEYNAQNGTWVRSFRTRGYWRRGESQGVLSTRPRQLQREAQREARSKARRLPPMELRVHLRNHRSDTIFSLWRPVRVTAVDDDGLEAPHRINRVDGAVDLSNPAGEMTYSVICDSSILDERFWQYQPVAWTEPQMDVFRRSPIRDLALDVLEQRGLDIPDMDAIRATAETGRAVRDVNAEIRGRRVYDRPKPVWPEPPDNARKIADAFQDYLQVNCVYTLDMAPPADGEDPIEMFLFRTQQGHCEYFASAMAAMCRSVGLQSRLVTGFAATEYDVARERFIVRESHAHAWVEVEVAPGVWATYDPSPQEQLAAFHHPELGLLAVVRRALDRLEGLWATRIVSFSQNEQSAMVNRAAETSDGPVGAFVAWVRDKISNAQNEPRATGGAFVLRTMTNFAVIMAFAVSAVLLLRGLVPAIRLRLWRTGGERARRAVDAPVFYTRMLAMLARAGLPKATHLPAGVHAIEVATAVPAAAGPVHALTALYQQARFSGRQLSSAQVQDARDKLEALRRALRHRNDGSEKRT